jgi:hypothetical protein
LKELKSIGFVSFQGVPDMNDVVKAPDRRDIFSMLGRGILSAGAMAGGASLLAGPARAQQQPVLENTTTKDEWLDALFQKRVLVNPLHLSRFVERIYFLTKTIAWAPNPGQPYKRVDVPPGFVTDFASIPAIFWSVLPPDGEYAYAAVIHDYLYWTQKTGRAEADDILKFAMQDLKVNGFTIGVVYGAVRAAGGFAWDDNAKLKASGEKRILKKFPDDPVTRWEDWKKRSDVFAD